MATAEISDGGEVLVWQGYVGRRESNEGRASRDDHSDRSGQPTCS
jgi:hypothetical protein